jgi:hypothetical protein
MTSSNSEIRDAILEAINNDAELFAELEALPDKIADTVREFTPILTGETVKSIEVKARRSAIKRLSTRLAKLGEVYSDDDPERVGAIEYGRGETDKHGGTPEFAMFRRAAAVWNTAEI